jgi:hypothetical protein
MIALTRESGGLIIARALTLACVVLVTAPLAQGAGSDPSIRQAANASRVIKLLASNISGKRYARPPTGIAGDLVVGRDRLLNAVQQFGRPRGATVGEARYRTVFERRAIATVKVTATLPGGTIQARGRVDFQKPSNIIRVIDGTGVFERASGTVEERVLQGGQTLNVYRLR